MGTATYKDGFSREEFEREIDAEIAAADPLDADNLRLVRSLLPACNAWLGTVRHPTDTAQICLALCAASASVVATVMASITLPKNRAATIRIAAEAISGMLEEAALEVETAEARKQ